MTSDTNTEEDFNIFVGGKTGALKGVKIDNGGIISKNLHNVQELKPENEISILNWGNKDQSEILVGNINQLVKVYNVDHKEYKNTFETKFGSGPLVGLTKINNAITTCSESGHIKIWKSKKNEEVELLTAGRVSRMLNYSGEVGIVATGGQKNDLKIWDLESKKSIFCAKNVRKDMLELEVPVWVSDLAFLSGYEYKVVVTTRFGQVRLYDTKVQRRPVIDLKLEDKPLNTISLCYNENHVIVGSTKGHVLLVDLRSKGKILHSYKGAVGSIRQVAAHPTLPYVASVGLDRYLRVHHLETKKLLHQEYLKVRLNCILMKSSFGKDILQKDVVDNEEEKIQNNDLESDEEYTEMFNNMESVCDEEKEPSRKKRKKK